MWMLSIRKWHVLFNDGIDFNTGFFKVWISLFLRMLVDFTEFDRYAFCCRDTLVTSS